MAVVLCTVEDGWCRFRVGDRSSMLCVSLQSRASMQAEMILKEEEAERQRKRIKELEGLQTSLEEALHQEIKARQDEEVFRYAQTG